MKPLLSAICPVCKCEVGVGPADFDAVATALHDEGMIFVICSNCATVFLFDGKNTRLLEEEDCALITEDMQNIIGELQQQVIKEEE